MGALRLARRFEFARVARNESMLERANGPNARKRVSGERTDEGVSMFIVIPGSQFLAHAHPRSMYLSSGLRLSSSRLAADLLRSFDNGWVTRLSVMKYVHICQLFGVGAQAVPVRGSFMSYFFQGLYVLTSSSQCSCQPAGATNSILNPLLINGRPLHTLAYGASLLASNSVRHASLLRCLPAPGVVCPVPARRFTSRLFTSSSRLLLPVDRVLVAV
ncbi:hypothetical protein EDB83DRAFT_242411 [Lactarius deliciosus]|nr:hypothetical protein EDB83DRAFT_242411 [Lactarius deliciosus]